MLVTMTEGLAKRYGDRQAIRLLAEAGFDALDYSMHKMAYDPNTVLCSDDWQSEVSELKTLAQSLGCPFVQGHAPYRFTDCSEAGWQAVNFPLLLRSIEIASMLGIQNLVVHPVHHLDYKKHRQTLYEWNMRFYSALIPHAKAAGVRICLENMWQRDAKRGNIISDDTCSAAEELAAWVDELNDQTIGACLDLGHCGLVGRAAEESITTLGSRLSCLHIHDNDFMSDLHTLPYFGHADWPAILSALGKVGYTGHFTFEADGFFEHMPDELIPDALRFMVRMGQYMMKQIK